MRIFGKASLLLAASLMAASPATAARPLSLFGSSGLTTMAIQDDDDDDSSEGFWSFKNIILLLAGLGAGLTAFTEVVGDDPDSP